MELGICKLVFWSETCGDGTCGFKIRTWGIRTCSLGVRTCGIVTLEFEIGNWNFWQWAWGNGTLTLEWEVVKWLHESGLRLQSSLWVTGLRVFLVMVVSSPGSPGCTNISQTLASGGSIKHLSASRFPPVDLEWECRGPPLQSHREKLIRPRGLADIEVNHCSWSKITLGTNQLMLLPVA